MILNRAGDNFRGAGGIAIHEHHQWGLRVALFKRGIVLVRVRHTATRVDDHLSALEEPVRHRDGLIEWTATVVAQVEHQTLHAFTAQLGQRLTDLTVSRLRKILQADVAGARRNHERRTHGGDVDLVAFHIKRNQRLEADASNADVDRRALGAAQFAHGLIGRPAFGRLAFDFGNHITAPNPVPIGR